MTTAKEALKFARHIEKHLREIYGENTKEQVICKICGKTIKEIMEE